MHKNGWTPERCRRQSELIQSWRPWEKSTGPRSDEGKAKVARNAWKGGQRELMRQFAAEMRQELASVADAFATFEDAAGLTIQGSPLKTENKAR